MKWWASILLVSVFVRFFGALTLSKLGGYSWQAWFYILGCYWEAMLCGLILTMVRNYFAKAAMWIGISEGLQTATCRLMIADITKVPKDQSLCDYVTGLTLAAPLTALYLFIICIAIAKNWRSASRS